MSHDRIAQGKVNIADYLLAKNELRGLTRPADIVLATTEAKRCKMDLAEAMGPGCIGYQLPDGGVVHETKFNSIRTLNTTRLSDAMNMLTMEDLTGDDPGVSIFMSSATISKSKRRGPLLQQILELPF